MQELYVNVKTDFSYDYVVGFINGFHLHKK